MKLHGNIGVTTATARLTLTWDVLKFIFSLAFDRFKYRLTLTWDVLKCVTTVLCCRCVND